MTEFSYFNLGFRSENILEELNNLMQQKGVNDLILFDALSIVKDCVSLKEENAISNNLTPSGYELTFLVPLVFTIFPGKKVDETIAQLKDILEAIEKLIKKEKIATERTEKIRTFFSTLSKLCLAQISNLSVERSIAIH